MNCQVSTSTIERNFKDLNKGCLCVTGHLDSPYARFFAHSPIFLSQKVVDDIKKSISTLEKAIRSDGFKNFVFKDISPKPKNVGGGILMSYDFHLDENEAPKLIEINTNAGGFFLNYELQKSTPDCCVNIERDTQETLEKKVVGMFRNEFKKVSRKELKSVVIMDENPEKQFLYPEFIICKKILEKNGITACILDPKDIEINNNAAYYDGVVIDLIYNRVTDFYFAKKENEKFLSLVGSHNTAISPSPEDHLRFADKMSLVYLQDRALFTDNVSENEMAIVRKTILETKVVHDDTKVFLWENRKKYFFKPVNGFGGGGAYNGRGLTKKVWANIISQKYVAQEIVAPNTKLKEVNGDTQIFKFDIRAYVYEGEVLLLGARVYQGQTTNFRTIGGGFSPVFITKN